MDELLEKLIEEHHLSREEWRVLLARRRSLDQALLFGRAEAERRRWYGDAIYVRGLIECTNICKNNCLYCGIRRGNPAVSRYRLERDTILDCCARGYEWGFRTFVLQGGEDPGLSPDQIAEWVGAIKANWPDCAVTLSLGEYERSVYQLWFDAGADRYLLRHETADAAHYAMLHPPEMALGHRLDCLRTLKEIGYQVGAGFMVGSPGQTPDTLAADFCFLQEFQPHMVGIGPFIPQKDTPFGGETAGTLEDTLILLALVRLLLPRVLLPATTALGTIHPQGRELGIKAGANVVMPNLSPPATREKYTLYDHKLCTGEEAAEHLAGLKRRLASIGCTVAVHRGDFPGN